MLEGIVLDFDGVICDSENVWRELLARTYRQYGVEFPALLFDDSIGQPEEVFDPFLYLSARVSQPPAYFEQMLRVQAARLLRATPPLPGVERLVKQARSHHIALGIASNASAEEIQPYLREWDLLPYFQTVVCRTDGYRQKPAPDAYEQALLRLDVAATRAVALEDSLAGLTAAHAAGIRCLAVVDRPERDHSFAQALLTIRSIAEIAITDGGDLIETRTGKVLA